MFSILCSPFHFLFFYPTELVHASWQSSLYDASFPVGTSSPLFARSPLPFRPFPAHHLDFILLCFFVFFFSFHYFTFEVVVFLILINFSTWYFLGEILDVKSNDSKSRDMLSFNPRFFPSCVQLLGFRVEKRNSHLHANLPIFKSLLTRFSYPKNTENLPT